PQSDAFERVDKARRDWLGGMPATDLPGKNWTTHEWVAFLEGMPAKLKPAQLTELDAAFRLTSTGNSEIAFNWPRIESYLTTIGRRRLVKPLYEELMKTPAGAERARAIYSRARPNYHPIAV